jgi:serine/threonine protein phosphatase PrpC
MGLPPSPRDHLAQGLAAKGAGDYRRAFDEFNQALRLWGKKNEPLVLGTLMELMQVVQVLDEQAGADPHCCDPTAEERECYAGRVASAGVRPYRLKAGECTLKGNVRETNQDAVAVHEFSGMTLCLVADGMGQVVAGRDSGKVACEQAFTILTRDLKENVPRARKPEEVRKAIYQSLVAANSAVKAVGAKITDSNAGASIVLALRRHGCGLYVAGVGDCLPFLVRGNRLEQLIQDDGSLVQLMVQAKAITAAEAKTHQYHNVLCYYLGSAPDVRPEIKFLAPEPGDRVLLCSDALYGTLTGDRILGCMHQHADVQGCADALCQLALDAGSKDNVSCIVMDVERNE